MVPAMFSFEIWKTVAKKKQDREVVAVLEATGELFNNKVRRHSSVSVEDENACLQLPVLWFLMTLV